MGKPEQDWWDLIIFRNVKIVWALRRAFHKDRPDIEKAFDPVLVFIWEQQIDLNLRNADFLSISAKQVSQPDMQFGCILWIEKSLYIF